MTSISDIIGFTGQLLDVIMPSNGMGFQCCYGCGNPDATVFGTATEHPSFIVGVCKKPDCIERAKKGIRIFLFEDDRDGHPMLFDEPIENVKVARSNGDIDSDWRIVGLWFPNNEISHLFVRKGMIEKKVRIANFLTDNPELENKLKEEKDKIVEKHLHMFDELEITTQD
jgi:hypothetical protein